LSDSVTEDRKTFSAKWKYNAKTEKHSVLNGNIMHLTICTWLE